MAQSTLGLVDSRLVGLHNWREAPHSRWAFQHVRGLIPTAEIRAAQQPQLFNDATASDLASLTVGSKSPLPLPQWLSQHDVDSVVVLRDGDLRWSWSAPYCDVTQPHIVFSISKSITAMLIGILVDQGVLDLSKHLPHYLPELGNGAYKDCCLRHLLDMTVALDFAEDYANPDQQYLAYRIATAWNPPHTSKHQDADSHTLATFLYTLRKADYEHGKRFSYKSPNSDLLGLIAEQASSVALADLLSDLIWQPMGAERDGYITLDKALAPRAAGGICVAVSDLARFGQLVLARGGVGDRSVIPESWIEDTFNCGDKTAWRVGDFAALIPNGAYRNKWYQINNDDRCMMAIGIHGQWLYLNPATRVVIAALSSQAEPLNDARDVEMLAVLHHCSRNC